MVNVCLWVFSCVRNLFVKKINKQAWNFVDNLISLYYACEWFCAGKIFLQKKNKQDWNCFDNLISLYYQCLLVSVSMRAKSFLEKINRLGIALITSFHYTTNVCFWVFLCAQNLFVTTKKKQDWNCFDNLISQYYQCLLVSVSVRAKSFRKKNKQAWNCLDNLISP